MHKFNTREVYMPKVILEKCKNTISIFSQTVVSQKKTQKYVLRKLNELGNCNIIKTFIQRTIHEKISHMLAEDMCIIEHRKILSKLYKYSL